MPGRLGVVADIHANAVALEAVLEDARRRGVARFVNLGDSLYGPLAPLETYRILQRTEIVASIAGNQDRVIFEAAPDQVAANGTLAFVVESLGDEAVRWLRQMPATAVVEDALFLCHGTPASDTTYLLEEVAAGRPQVRSEEGIRELLGDVGEPVVLCGHSHIPRLVRMRNGQLIVNPGSVGLQAYDDDEPVRVCMETHAPHACYAIVEGGRMGWDVSFHRVCYDWERAAAQALALHRQDWARAIASGRMD